MHRIKKILYYSLIIIGFTFCFIFGKNKINILAMGNFDNSIGTIPIQMDIDNYDNSNLVDFSKIIYNSHNSSFTIDNNQTITIDIKPLDLNDTSRISGGIFFNIPNLEDRNYHFSFSVKANSNGKLSFGVENSNIQDSLISTEYERHDIIINPTKGNFIMYVYYWDNINVTNIYVTDLMISNDYEEYYSPVFKFGYNASLSYLINTSSNTSVNYYFNDNTYTKTTNSIDSGYLIENYYLPFNIDSKGYISLSNISFGISSISNGSNNNTYSLYLELTPVFSAYYKGEYTTNIYTKLNYMSNDLFFSGISFSGCNDNNCSNTINAGNLSLTNPKILAITELNDTGSISTTNVSTYYNDDIRNRNYFDYYNYLNVSFRLGGLAENYNRMNGVNYSFGISSLASRIVDNQTTTTPLPDNELTNDKYNTCSAWYDIPCQLGNAVTYVIYEAPIISPIIEFFDSFIDLIGSLITYITWFEGLGLIFGVFIVILFIRMIILLVKGGNDD